jgi:Family of unknown function (DUF5906)
MSDEEDNVIRLAKLKESLSSFGFQRKAEEAPVINNTKDLVLWLNKTFAKMILKGKFKILREKDDGTIEFMDRKDFIYHHHERKLTITGEDDKPKAVPFSEIWLGSQWARKYDNGITFNPKIVGDYDGMYNLWKGWKTKPIQGDVGPFTNYIKSIICDDHDGNYNYLVALISQMFQEPWNKPGIAVIIRGDEGVGKSFFVEKLGELMSPYYFKTSNPEYIFGDHNGQIKDKLILHSEEAFWAGSKKIESQLKDAIVGPTNQINEKFVPVYDVPNHIHWFLTGNPDWIVKASPNARRFFALHASDRKRVDTEYFGELNRWFNNGGGAALMYFFLNYKVDIDLRKVPVTDELINQKQKSLDPVADWIYSIVNSKEMPYGEVIDGKVLVIKAILHNDYNHSPSGKRHNMNEWTFGNQFKDLLPEMETKDIKIRDSRDVRRNGYRIPDLITCRKLLETKLGGSIKWNDANDNDVWTCLRGNTDFDFSLYKI